jgi:hypothetical protein
MDLYKKKAGGCSSMSYAGISDNYMLMDNALVKTGGREKKSRRKNDDMFGGDPLKRRGGNPKKDDMFGGDPLKRRGGNPKKDDMFGGDPLKRRGGVANLFFSDMNGGKPLNRRDNELRRRGGDGDVGGVQAPPASMLGFGSAMKGFTDTIASMSKGGDDKKEGGCGMKSCKKKGGTTGLEIAPFISSLVLLGLRAANDKALQVGITKKLGSLVSEKTKTKTKTKSKSKTKTKSIFD